MHLNPEELQGPPTMTKDTRDTTPAGNIFLDFLKQDPITDSSVADIPEIQRIQI
jgi:hypothetical protein